MADDAAEQWGAEVIVTLKDGRRLSRRVDNLVGRGGDNPMSADELWEKFSDCAVRALPREQIAPLFERLETLDKVAEIGQVTRLLEVSSLHTNAAEEDRLRQSLRAGGAGDDLGAVTSPLILRCRSLIRRPRRMLRARRACFEARPAARTSA